MPTNDTDSDVDNLSNSDVLAIIKALGIGKQSSPWDITKMGVPLAAVIAIVGFTIYAVDELSSFSTKLDGVSISTTEQAEKIEEILDDINSKTALNERRFLDIEVRLEQVERTLTTLTPTRRTTRSTDNHD